MTEVHHIQADGDDAGVVYCEMQGRENTCDALTMRRLTTLLFPNCGYSAETGGILSNVRKLNVEQVRQYHRDYYRPDNLLCVVVGQVDPEAIFAALAPIESRIASKASRFARNPRFVPLRCGLW